MEHAVDTFREQSVLRTETIGSVITMIFSVSKSIVSGIDLLAARDDHIRSEEDYFRYGNNLVAFKLYCFGAGLNRL